VIFSISLLASDLLNAERTATPARRPDVTQFRLDRVSGALLYATSDELRAVATHFAALADALDAERTEVTP
jgi:hypothetical protein